MIDSFVIFDEVISTLVRALARSPVEESRRSKQESENTLQKRSATKNKFYSKNDVTGYASRK